VNKNNQPPLGPKNIGRCEQAVFVPNQVKNLTSKWWALLSSGRSSKVSF